MGLIVLPDASIASCRISRTFDSLAFYGRISIYAKIEIEPVYYCNLLRLVFS